MPLWLGRVIKFSVRLLVAGALLVWVLGQIDCEHLRETIQVAKWRYLLGVWLSAAVFFWVQSLALKLILAKQGCEVSLNTLFGASCVTTLYSLVLPGILSTSVKWYILSRDTGKASNVLSSMLYNQMALTVVMTTVGLVGLIVTNPTRILFPDARRQWLLPVVCAVVLVLVVLLSALVLNERTGGTATRILAVALRPLPRRVQDKGREMLTQIKVFQNAGWRFHMTIALINAVAGLPVGLLMYLFAARAASVVAPPGVLIWLCAMIYVLGRLPVSIANLGVREVALVGLLAGYGVTQPAALLMSMILFSSVIFLAAIGVSYQLFWAVREKSLTRKSGAA